MRFNGVGTGRWTKWAALCILLLLLTLVLIVCNSASSVGYDGYAEPTDDFIADWSQDDPRLWRHIRSNYVEAPAARHVPYNLLNPSLTDFSERRQSSVVAELFKDPRAPGFFLEAGGYDGETSSNSLYFERTLNWTGVLVEPDFANLVKLRAKRRKAFVVRACLDGSTRPVKVELAGAADVGTFEKNMGLMRRMLTRMWRPYVVTRVWCFPIYAILAALNRTAVDYMSLDLEGGELDVLRSIPFDRLDVKVFQIEYMAFNGIYWDWETSIARRDKLREFFAKRVPRYTEYASVYLDMIFVRSDYLARVRASGEGATETVVLDR